MQFPHRAPHPPEIVAGGGGHHPRTMTRAPAFQMTRPLTRSQTGVLLSRTVAPQCMKPRTRRVPRRPRAVKTLVQDLQTRLEQSAQPTYAAWLKRYLRNFPCRGLKNPQIRDITHAWAGEHGLFAEAHPHPQELGIARELFASPWVEDKHAGTIFLHGLQTRKRFGVGDTRVDDIAFVERLFDHGLLDNWSTVDSFSLRIVAGFAGDQSGAAHVSTWVHVENLWRARAGVVGLIPHVKNGCAQVLENCETLVRRDERFAKTAVGWALREVERVDRQKMIAFLTNHAACLSMEAARNAVKHVPEDERKRLLALVKGAGK